MSNASFSKKTSGKASPIIIIVGAGAAGIGMGVLLKRLGLPFVILEQSEVGASFLRWPIETQFISPSFSGNSFGAVDLNAITPETSPAFTLYTEHPTGLNYVKYLKAVVGHYKLPILTGLRVDRIDYDEHDQAPFFLETNEGFHCASHVIWAAGEFQYPNRGLFEGAEHCMHYADIHSWAELEGDNFCVIGGYESGVDAAYQLAKLGKSVTIFDGNDQINLHSSDSSYSLSPFTRDRLNERQDKIKIVSSKVVHVERFEDGVCTLTTSDDEKYGSRTLPINCIGFDSSTTLIEHLFEKEDGHLKLNHVDESTIYPNIFLVGPQVQHQRALFCFIYKFRQRFGIVGEALSKRIGGDKALLDEVINEYRRQQFYLDDLSCCDDECDC